MVVPASAPLALRGLGIASMLLGVVLVVALVVAAVLEGSARTFVLVLLTVVGVPLIGAVLTQVFRLLGWGARFVHSPQGFENHTSVFGVGRRSAAWTEVTGLREVTDILMIELGDKRSLVDCRVLGRSPSSLGEELRPYVGKPFG
ncbi:MAG: hypothetical protein WCA29_10330 [Jiangellales bacterium]